MTQTEIKAGIAVLSVLLVGAGVGLYNTTPVTSNTAAVEEELPTIVPYNVPTLSQLPSLTTAEIEFDDEPLPEIKAYDEPLLELVMDDKEELPPLEGGEA